MFKKLITQLKTKKRLVATVAIIGIFLLLVALGIDNSVKDEVSHLPFFIKNNPGQQGVNNLKTRGNLVLVKVTPPNNYRGVSYGNVGTIVFTFNMPVDEKSLKFSVTPSINMDFGVYKNDPNRLWMKPVNGWFVGIEHTVMINDLASTTGEYIGDKIKYIYYTNPPRIMDGADLPD